MFTTPLLLVLILRNNVFVNHNIIILISHSKHIIKFQLILHITVHSTILWNYNISGSNILRIIDNNM